MFLRAHHNQGCRGGSQVTSSRDMNDEDQFVFVMDKQHIRLEVVWGEVRQQVNILGSCKGFHFTVEHFHLFRSEPTWVQAMFMQTVNSGGVEDVWW